MKRIGKVLSLLLIAVMLLALLPSAAFADPPQSDPTHQHNWVVQDDTATCTASGKRVWVCTVCGQTYGEASPAKGHDWNGGKVTKAATCEKDGVKTYTCSRCQNTRTEAIHALGHDWDEGKVTSVPHGFTPGVTTYTCKRDASHTRTVEIDPLPWVFAALSGVTIDPSLFDLSNYDIPPLEITEQPKGGSIIRWADESVTLHVAATGGIGEYTYEWHSHAQDVGKDEKYNDLLKWFVGLFGVTTEQVDAALEASLSDTDTLVATSGNESYYCVVTDAMGNSVRSDMAAVSYKVSIAKQPDNVNLQESNHDFYCEAIDGSGDYTYRWFDHDEGILGEGQSYPAEKEGYYYCIVTDNVTGETATSEYCEVYDTAPFRLADITGDFELTSDADAAVIASFTGGVEDYEIWWKKDGVAIDSVEDRDAQNNVRSRANVDGPGVYTVYAADSMYATVSASVNVTAPKLTIVAQPKGGTIPKGSYTTIHVTVSDGEAPYRFVLYRNGEYYVEVTDDPAFASFGVWYPGNYYFHIEDSKGREADTDVVTFEDAVFRITAQSEAEQITSPSGSTALFVEAEGGMEPYTYTWTWRSGDNTYDLGRNADLIPVFDVGKYTCVIEDKDGQRITSKPMQVTYGGEAPWIVVQPQSKTDLTLNADGTVNTALFCNAISGTGDKNNLKYVWEIYIPGIGWAQTTTTEQWLNVHTLGSYRCRVVDKVTGKYTYSNTAVVCEKLAYQGCESWHSYDPGYINYHFSFTGGVGPYTVKVYQNRDTYLVRVGGMKQVLYKTETVNSAKELRSYQVYVPVSNDVITEEDGELRRYSEYSEYFVVVTDSSGQTCESEVRGLLLDINR